MCLFSAWHNAALISTQTRGCCTNNRTEMNLVAGGGEVTGCLMSASPGGIGAGCRVSAASLQDRAPGGCIPTKKGGISRLHPCHTWELPRIHQQLPRQLVQEATWIFLGVPVTNK